MANTTTRAGNTISVSAIDSDWSWATTMGGKCRLSSIQVSPAGADVIVVRDGSATGPTLFRATPASALEQNVKYFDGQWCIPYIKFTDCTVIGAGTTVTFIVK